LYVEREVRVFHNGHADSGLPLRNCGNGCANGGVRYNVQYTLRDQTQHSNPLADSSLSADRFERDTIDILKRLSQKPIEPTLTSALLADLGFDSLQVLELVGELEDHFNIAVPLNALTHIRTVGEIVAEVRRLVHVQESQP
jgi:acyl carrier protein